jgi:DNA-binding NarL/FixJ family response regulator
MNTVAARKLRVIVADDDVSMRQDLRRLLELEPDIEVVAIAQDGQHAVQQSARLHPDVVVLDVRMPVLDGISATRLLRHPDRDHDFVGENEVLPAVLILTTFDLDEYVLGAIRAGAAGFLLKDQAPELLAPAVRTVARGEAILGPRATARLLEEFTKAPSIESPVLDSLTRREREVLALVSQGLSNEEVAESLIVSVPTVKTHVSNLLMKLGLENRVQAVVWAYENGVARVSRSPHPRG